MFTHSLDAYVVPFSLRVISTANHTGDAWHWCQWNACRIGLCFACRFDNTGIVTVRAAGLSP